MMHFSTFKLEELIDTQTDVERGMNVLSRFIKHFEVMPVITGGLAVSWHCFNKVRPMERRSLHDIDFVLEGIEFLPKTLTSDFLVRHFHPTRGRGKTLAQFVAEAERVRIDIFTPFSQSFRERVSQVYFSGTDMYIISAEDLLARFAAIIHPASSTSQVDPKYRDRFIALSEIADWKITDEIWKDYRKEDHPHTIARTIEEIHEIIGKNPTFFKEDLYEPEYECAWCLADESFPVGSRPKMIEILGY